MSDIHDAARDGDLAKIKILIKGSPHLVLQKDDRYNSATPLHLAASNGHKDVVTFLLANRADINVRNVEGRTPLHQVVGFGGFNLDGRNIEMVKLLLSNDADVNATDDDRQTPLDDARGTSDGQKSVKELLRRHGGVSQHDFYEAVRENNYAKVKNLLRIAPGLISAKQGRRHGSCLHWAMEQGLTDISTLLIENKANTNAKNEGGQTPLHLAARRPVDRQDISDPAIQARIKWFGILEFLLANGADVNAEDSSGSTPLDYAEQSNNTTMAQILRRHRGISTEFNGTRGIEKLCEALYIESDEIRAKRAKEALEKLGTNQAVNAVCKVLEGSVNNFARAGAAKLLGKIGDARAPQVLLAAFRDDYSGVREQAARALGKFGGGDAVQALLRALGDEDDGVRAGAARALTEIGGPAVEGLSGALGGNEGWRAAEALGQIGDPRAVKALRATLVAGGPLRKRKVALALLKIGDTQDVGFILNYILGPNDVPPLTGGDRIARERHDKRRSSDFFSFQRDCLYKIESLLERRPSSFPRSALKSILRLHSTDVQTAPASQEVGYSRPDNLVRLQELAASEVSRRASQGIILSQWIGRFFGLK